LYVTQSQHLKHFDGSSWTDITPAVISGLAAKSLTYINPNDMWLSGKNGRVGYRIHFDGSQWTPLVAARSAERRTITFTNGQKLAIGRLGGASLLSGSNWTHFRLPSNYDFGLFDVATINQNAWIFSFSPSNQNAIVLRKR
jgi:hypothetical protein